MKAEFTQTKMYKLSFFQVKRIMTRLFFVFNPYSLEYSVFETVKLFRQRRPNRPEKENPKRISQYILNF
jgi:hypothetical protein